MMDLLAVGVAVLVSLVVAAAALLLSRSIRLGESDAETGEADPSDGVHFRAVGALLNEAGQWFFAVLEGAVIGPPYRVMCEVRLADFVQANFKTIHDEASDRDVGNRRIATAQNRIEWKHCDFVLIDAQTLVARAAVDLDDVSHRSDKARKADGVKDAALASRV